MGDYRLLGHCPCLIWRSCRRRSNAKLERRTDMYISTLRSHIEAMGGELEVVARFPDGNVKISNFADLASQASSYTHESH
jgi:hypothetical protein